MNLFKQTLINSIEFNDLQLALRMEDRNSMASSIENRAPFLDHKFVEYVLSIKSKYFFKSGFQKFMLRDAMKKISIKSILNRKVKIGRPGNDNLFIFEIFFDEFLDLLNSFGEINKIVNIDKLKKRLLNEKKSKKYLTNGNFYFRLFNYLKWKEIYSL